jgi:putative transposase
MTTRHAAPLPLPLQLLLLFFAGWVNRAQQDVIEYLKAEIAVLMELLGDRRPRLTDGQRRRLATKGHVLGRKALGEVAGIVAPDTILRWFRELVARKYDGTARRGPGRPRIAEPIASVIVRVAKANPTLGYTRIMHALVNLKRRAARSTVARVLKESGIEPAPERGRACPGATSSPLTGTGSSGPTSSPWRS